jgi:hypothetical protein
VSALVVESLEARLERLIPGAFVERQAGAAPDATFVVFAPMRSPASSLPRGVLATGASAREAIDRATFLWGAR